MNAPPTAIQVFITWLARTAFAVGLVLVIVLSLTPASDLPPTGINDKIEHFLGYFALAAAGATGFHGRRHRLLVILGLIALGFLMEFGQMFAPGRNPSIADGIANAFGVLCGATMGSLGMRVLDALRPLLKAP